MTEVSQVEQKWLDAKVQLLEELHPANSVEFHIPGWQPVDLAQALHWLRSSIYEGFCVEHRTDWLSERAVVYFRIWEYGDDKPEWSATTAR